MLKPRNDFSFCRCVDFAVKIRVNPQQTGIDTNVKHSMVCRRLLFGTENSYMPLISLACFTCSPSFIIVIIKIEPFRRDWCVTTPLFPFLATEC